MVTPNSGNWLTIRSLGALVLVLVVMAQLQPTESSSFVFYSTRCVGNSATLNACGCNTIPSNTRGGYKFTYSGQTAAAYNAASCTGVAQTRFQGTTNTGQCTPVGWQSVFIQC